LHQHLAVAATALASVGGAFSDYSGEIGLRAGGSALRTTLVAISHPSAASANGTTSGQLESFANTTSTSTMPSARPSNAPTTPANGRIPSRYAARRQNSRISAGQASFAPEATEGAKDPPPLDGEARLAAGFAI